MKRLSTLLLLLPLLWGCNEDTGTTIEPADRALFFRFEVTDALDGIDLLNPELSDFGSTPISILYNERSYALSTAEPGDALAFTLRAGREEEPGYLLFGPFDYLDNHIDEEFIIDWDYTDRTDLVRFSLPYEWTGYTGIVEQRMQVNDGEVLTHWEYSFSKEQPTWEFTNYSVYFYVEDALGNDLLDPDYEGNILGQDIKVTYNDVTYPRYKNPGLGLREDTTRETLPLQFGLRWGQKSNEEDAPYCLAFGEFAPEGYRNTTFTLDWGDDTSTKLELNCYLTWSGWSPTVTRTLKVDGTDQKEDWDVVITKNR